MDAGHDAMQHFLERMNNRSILNALLKSHIGIDEDLFSCEKFVWILYFASAELEVGMQFSEILDFAEACQNDIR